MLSLLGVTLVLLLIWLVRSRDDRRSVLASIGLATWDEPTAEEIAAREVMRFDLRAMRVFGSLWTLISLIFAYWLMDFTAERWREQDSLERLLATAVLVAAGISVRGGFHLVRKTVVFDGDMWNYARNQLVGRKNALELERRLLGESDGTDYIEIVDDDTTRRVAGLRWEILGCSTLLVFFGLVIGGAYYVLESILPVSETLSSWGVIGEWTFIALRIIMFVITVASACLGAQILLTVIQRYFFPWDDDRKLAAELLGKQILGRRLQLAEEGDAGALAVIKRLPRPTREHRSAVESDEIEKRIDHLCEDPSERAAGEMSGTTAIDSKASPGGSFRELLKALALFGLTVLAGIVSMGWGGELWTWFATYLG